MSLTKEKKQLTEEVGMRIEQSLRISPLAARIYALLTLSSYEGLTFEEIRETIAASKSSVSVNINLLTQLGYVEYHTKSGDRKRYFKVAKYYQLVSLELYHQSLNKDVEMVNKINTYNKAYHPEKFTAEKSVGSITQAYLRKTQALVKNTLKKLIHFQKNEKK